MKNQYKTLMLFRPSMQAVQLKKLTITQKLLKLKRNGLIIIMNIFLLKNLRLKEAKLVFKADNDDDLVEKTDFDDKLKY